MSNACFLNSKFCSAMYGVFLWKWKNVLPKRVFPHFVLKKLSHVKLNLNGVLLKGQADLFPSLFLFVCHLSPGHGHVPIGVPLCSPGSPGYSIPYSWYMPIICLIWSQQSGHTPMFLWGGCSIVPLQGCAEPSCLWWLLNACSARLQAAAGWRRLEQLLLGGGIAHLPTDTEQAESVKHTHLLLCILPTFLRAWMDVQLSQAHTAKSQFTLHPCWRCYTWDIYICVCIKLSFLKLLQLVHFLSFVVILYWFFMMAFFWTEIWPQLSYLTASN